MSKKMIGFVLIALGAVMAVVSLGADIIGIGNKLGFGWQQLLGTTIGVIVLLVGVWLALSKPNQK
jgi:uncharacterized membrane protein YgaE (UPF0421/DUF939 family)